MNWHMREKCAPAIEDAKKKRLEYLRNLPLEKLTRDTATECGKLEEWVEYLRSLPLEKLTLGTAEDCGKLEEWTAFVRSHIAGRKKGAKA